MSLPPVYSQRFLGAQLGGAAQVAASVPAGYRWIVRDIDLFLEETAANEGGQVYATTSAGATIWLPMSYIPGVGGGHVQWTGRQVLNPGDVLVYSQAAGTGVITVSGYALTLP